MHIRPIITGLLSYIPGMKKLHYYLSKGKIGESSARYCYSVWMRHLSMANSNGILSGVPLSIAELGPGNTLGVGLAGLISGAEKYYGLDVVKYCSSAETLDLFDEIVELFKRKSDIPGENEFPDLKPCLDSYKFPNYIFGDGRLEKALCDERISKIRNAVSNFSENSESQKKEDKDASNDVISYYVPWHEIELTEEMTVDMIYSQAVMEHVDNLSLAYKKMRIWLKPGGILSHQIDFKSHGTADKWNGQWGYGDFIWKIIKGGKPYLINRAPHSKHIDILKREGLKIVCDARVEKTNGIQRDELASKFKSLSDEDLRISGAFLQAVK
ncbi:MAG: methyltransferase domain-containing protein [Elusimicrobiales bacterium]|nr:methyltransferase domain-containing protein [Elusimicrobiales bacterium]